MKSIFTFIFIVLGSASFSSELIYCKAVHTNEVKAYDIQLKVSSRFKDHYNSDVFVIQGVRMKATSSVFYDSESDEMTRILSLETALLHEHFQGSPGLAGSWSWEPV